MQHVLGEQVCLQVITFCFSSTRNKGHGTRNKGHIVWKYFSGDWFWETFCELYGGVDSQIKQDFFKIIINVLK